MPMRLNGFSDPADGPFVPVKTRLDPVVRLEESRRDKRLSALADANRKLTAAQALVATARTSAAADHRGPGSACQWQLAESSHTRALVDLAQAEQAQHQAAAQAGESRRLYLDARARAKTIARVADARREDITRELDRKESQQFDELQMMLRPHRRRSL